MERSVIHGSTESIVYDRGAGPWSPGKLSSGADRWCLHSIKWKRNDMGEEDKERTRADFNPRYFSFCSATSRYLGLGVKLFPSSRRKKEIITKTYPRHDKPDRKEWNFLIITRSKFFAILFALRSTTHRRNTLRCSLIPTGKSCKNAFPVILPREATFFPKVLKYFIAAKLSRRARQRVCTFLYSLGWNAIYWLKLYKGSEEC